MNLTASLLLDIVLALFLAWSIVQGFRRGFILTLCSLLAVFIALAGGWYLANQYAAPVQEALEPVMIRRMVPDRPEEAAAQNGETPSLAGSVQEQVENAAQAAQTALIVQQAKALAELAAKVLMFLVGFVGVLVIWLILCHALDLVAKLPGLHFLNRAMGAVLGLVKGLILLMVLRWLLCDALHLIPEEITEGSYVLSLLSSFLAVPDSLDLWRI